MLNTVKDTRAFKVADWSDFTEIVKNKMTNIDTRAVFKKLVAAGCSEQQAEAFLYGYNTPLNALVFYRKLIDSGFNERQSEISIMNTNIKWLIAIVLIILGILLKNTFI